MWTAGYVGDIKYSSATWSAFPRPFVVRYMKKPEAVVNACKNSRYEGLGNSGKTHLLAQLESSSPRLQLPTNYDSVNFAADFIKVKILSRFKTAMWHLLVPYF